MPPGPAEKSDLHTTEESFYRVADLLQEYGEVTCLHSAIRQSDSYLVNHPDYIKHILVNNNQNYNKGPGFERVKMLLGNGIIVSDGVFWRRQRRMIQPGFSRQLIAGMMDDVKACNLRLLDDWLQKARNNDVVDITEEMSQLSLEIILRVLLGGDYERILEEQGENPFAILTQDPSRDMRLVLKYRALTGIIQDIIDHRRRHPLDGEDFLSSFMAAEDKDTGEPMTDKEVIEAMNMLRMAGVEMLTLGQYLQPSLNHLAVDRFVTPEEFDRLASIARELGFSNVASGPMVRSSYHADLQALGKIVK